MHEVCEDGLYLQEGISFCPSDVVIDAVANIAVFKLYTAKQGTHVYAFEPVPPTFAVLRQNVRSHGLLKQSAKLD